MWRSPAPREWGRWSRRPLTVHNLACCAVQRYWGTLVHKADTRHTRDMHFQGHLHCPPVQGQAQARAPPSRVQLLCIAMSTLQQQHTQLVPLTNKCESTHAGFTCPGKTVLARPAAPHAASITAPAPGPLPGPGPAGARFHTCVTVALHTADRLIQCVHKHSATRQHLRLSRVRVHVLAAQRCLPHRHTNNHLSAFSLRCLSSVSSRASGKQVLCPQYLAGGWAGNFSARASGHTLACCAWPCTLQAQHD